MKDEATPECPRIEAISALIDGELTGRAGEELAAHTARCSLCAPVLREFSAMAAQLRVLRETRCDVDLAAIVDQRLPAREPARRRRSARRWSGLWQLAPRGFGAAAALAAGAYLGLSLVAGSGAALRPAAMAAFDAVPPGAMCAGLPACSPRGR